MTVARRPLPPPLPASPPDERLIVSLAEETGVPVAVVRAWLNGGKVRPDVREALLRALWAPVGGYGSRAPTLIAPPGERHRASEVAASETNTGQLREPSTGECAQRVRHA